MGQFRAADLLRRKPVALIEGEHPPEHLHRSIGLFQLTMLGVGATIGTGIFVALTTAVPAAGPAVILSFVLAGITAALTALCYAELASTIPVSGSSYSYAYATLGEFVAFVVGACLLLEYAVSASAIAVGWGQYLNEMLTDLVGWKMPDVIAKAPGAGGVFNLPAVALVGACMVLLLRGVKESTTINAILVVLKLAILVFFVVVAFTGFHAHNLSPFMPMGWKGVGAAAASIFFSYIGIDAVSTAGEEVKDPRRTLPAGIVLSLLIVTAIYILVAVAAIGAQPWTAFAGQEAGLAVILRNLTGQAWTSLVLCVGAIVSIFSITLVVMYGQTRILYAMSRDGLLPKLFQRLDPKTRTPDLNTYIVAVFIAVLAAFVPLDVLVNLTSMGTLIAFAIVSLGVIILRRTQPDLPRGYKVPLFPALPAASVAFCGYLIWKLPLDTWALFAVWVAGACVVYFGYSVRHSRLAA
ncbi:MULTISPECIES: amino acid permease [Caulobacter]|jgi:APA family basic amino acid/polyamine antiporter|uniref:Amino acid/polyamine/organocation transporter, APC superfamily n=1 Tax=Caulobacter vibrioides OR37 TaxID=1292034 RepID=R0CQ71_CAUVI|nr:MULTISPECIES: amino acid permease [Caulobacter]ENZ78575.1 amino acid/polyamine/organocation transporter, APC superfamily [Caulobacter vibrioides OR37]MBQ1563473.1 amino acid permease [Caulobacter sp.]